MLRHLPIPLAFAALLLLPGSLQSVVAQEGDGVASERSAVTDSTALRKELEVMRRVLGRRVGNVAQTSLYVNYGSAHYSASEAYYVHGAGATFVMHVNHPVAAGAAKPAATGKEPTLWDEVLADVEGRPNPRTKSKKQHVYDAAKVTTLETNLLEALGRYGGNLAQIGEREMLTVIIGGPAVNGASGAYTVSTTGAADAARYALLSAQRVHRSTSGTVLTIRVSRADCVARAAGRLDAEEFRAKAKIHSY